MVRLSELPAAEAQCLMEVECPTFDREPWVTGPVLAERRVALVSSAGLNLRGDRPFLSSQRGLQDHSRWREPRRCPDEPRFGEL